MPDLDLDEADRCKHCGKILRFPPNCCPGSIQDYDTIYERVYDEAERLENLREEEE